MHRLTALFLSLLLVLSLGLGSAAHASEGLGCLEVSSATSIGHAEGDGDEVPADSEKGYPHHHGGCHGHHVGVPVTPDTLVLASALGVSPLPRHQSARPLALADPALRPPRA